MQILIIKSRLINNKQKLTRNKSPIYGVKVLSQVYRNNLHEKMNQLIVVIRAINRLHKQQTSKILRERKISFLINKLELKKFKPIQIKRKMLTKKQKQLTIMQRKGR